MATQAQIDQIAAELHRIHPAPFFKNINDSNAGLGAVVRFLSEAQGDITAGSIAQFLDVSTARVAVLLKKLTAKGLIVKESAATDGRVTIVRLSEQGIKTAQTMRDTMSDKIGRIIDRVGMDRVLEFITIANEICQVVPEPPADLEDCLK